MREFGNTSLRYKIRNEYYKKPMIRGEQELYYITVEPTTKITGKIEIIAHISSEK